jgi:hypothetical protein
MNDQPVTADTFDRILGALTGLPDHRLSRPSTVTTVLPILGNAQSYIVRTMRMPRGTFIGFIEMIDATGKIRIAVPEKAMAALYRQRESLSKQTRSARGKERWRGMSDDQRERAVARLKRKK